MNEKFIHLKKKKEYRAHAYTRLLKNEENECGSAQTSLDNLPNLAKRNETRRTNRVWPRNGENTHTILASRQSWKFPCPRDPARDFEFLELHRGPSLPLPSSRQQEYTTLGFVGSLCARAQTHTHTQTLLKTEKLRQEL